MEQRPSPQEFQPFDDLVNIDSHARGHRPDGKFLSQYEIEQIGSHQDLIRSLEPTEAYVGRHRATESETAELSAAQEAVTGLPVMEQSANFSEFLTKRWDGLRGAWHKTKQLAGKLGDHLAIEHNGYRLTASENARARLARLRMLTKPELGLRDEHNPVVKKAFANSRNTVYTKADYAKLAAYELVTLPVVRGMGLMAIQGATERVATKRAATGAAKGIIGNAHDYSRRQLARHEDGTYNPVIRRKRAAATRGPRDPFAGLAIARSVGTESRRDPFEHI